MSSHFVVEITIAIHCSASLVNIYITFLLFLALEVVMHC